MALSGGAVVVLLGVAEDEGGRDADRVVVGHRLIFKRQIIEAHTRQVPSPLHKRHLLPRLNRVTLNPLVPFT